MAQGGTINEQVGSLPELPGVYRFFDTQGQLLYVGKAKNLKRRVSSYFNKNHGGSRIGVMVSKIATLQTTVVQSEYEALLLENNLIKSLNPKFNIVFRDDKSYPYLKISRHKYPQVAYYRGSVDKKHYYFGPYPNAYAVKQTIAILQRVFQLRNCEDNVLNNRSRPCLLYQIKRCAAPCIKVQIDKKNPAVLQNSRWLKLAAELDYDAKVAAAVEFLKGNTTQLLQKLQEQMQQFAVRLEYEQAAAVRNQITALAGILQQQTVELSSANSAVVDVDVLAVKVHGGRACVNLALIRGGRHLGDRAFFPAQVADALAVQQELGAGAKTQSESWVNEQVLNAFVLQHYAAQYVPQQIIAAAKFTPAVTKFLMQSAKHKPKIIYHPQGQRKIWLSMAEKNAQLQLQQLLAQEGSQRARTQALIEALALDGVNAQDLLVECFDISHTAGEATQASCVVFAQHKMQPSRYRRYNINGIVGGDDYAAMQQVLQRRYTKFAAHNQEADGAKMPDIVLIDGGKGQVNAAKKVFVELGLDISCLVGVEKGDKRKVGLEELVFADGRQKIYLGKDSAALMLIAQIRDEAHRFAITGMRARRAAVRTKASSLEEIAGIGAKKRAELLKRFGSAKGVSNASVIELASVPGISTKLAQAIYAALH